MKKDFQQLLKDLKAEPVHTWFDLGLFLDRFKDQHEQQRVPFAGSLDDFKKNIGQGIGFVTFNYGIDGVTMEVVKYAQAFRALFPKVPVHLISGHINEMGQGMLGDQYHIHTIQGLDGFDPWPLYEDLFIQKLERGGPVYNG